MSAAPAVHAIATGTHGRYLVEAPPGAGPWPVLMGFHGYAETAGLHLEQLARLDPSHAWLRVSVQGLHRFYTRAQDVVASWMTREDRGLAMADNLAYAAAVRAAVARDYATTAPLVMVGFSQGAAQAYRAGLAAGARCAGIIALGGDLPPDVADEAAALPPVLIGRGHDDPWYSAARLDEDRARLTAAGTPFTVCEFDGAHEWADLFVQAAAVWLAARRA
ncbi:MAG: dienelactone hydrolase family protein [Acidobacteria bacterium]|nr:dienelactone hydrolase family protein [Acidobacteriota bacterium]